MVCAFPLALAMIYQEKGIKMSAGAKPFLTFLLRVIRLVIFRPIIADQSGVVPQHLPVVPQHLPIFFP
jgi:hypothetical protein